MLSPKLIDRYVLRQFFLAALVSMVSFIIIYIAVDLMEKLDKFLDHHVPFHTVVEYYVNFTPQIIALILPVCLLLGSLFATGRMSISSEIIAMRSGGISLYRLMAPFIIASAIISAFSVYFDGWILPKANRRVEEIIRDDIHEDLMANQELDIYLQIGRGQILSMADYSWGQRRGTSISLQNFDPQNITRMVSRIDAGLMVWDSIRSEWRLEGAVQRTFPTDTSAETIRRLTPAESYFHFPFTPQELKDRQLRSEEMTNTEFRQRIELKRRAGQDESRDEVDYQTKYSLAFSSLIVVLFGVPFASKKKRAGLSFEFSIAIGIAFVYLTFSKIFASFGYTGEASPMLTAWLPNLLFFAGSLLVIWKAQK